MKTTKLMKGVLFATILIAFVLIGCEKLDTYTIGAPSDLQSRIDSIAAEKANQSTGDTTYLDIATAIVVLKILVQVGGLLSLIILEFLPINYCIWSL